MIVLAMRAAVANGATIASQARKYGVPYATARAAIVGDSWAWLPRAIKPGYALGEDAGSAKLTESQVLAIYARKGEPTSVLAGEFAVRTQTILEIWSGETWRQITGAEPGRPRARHLKIVDGEVAAVVVGGAASHG